MRALARVRLVCAVALLLLGLTIVVGVHGFLLRHAELPLAADEAYIGAFAVALIEGQWLPYVDAVSQRGPLLYWTAALFQWQLGEYSVTGLRVLALLLALGALAGAFVAGLAARRPLAGAVGGTILVFFACVVLAPAAGPALNGEPMAATVSLLALAALSVGLRPTASGRRRLLLVALAGGLAAGAALCKQTAVVLLVPFVLWTLAAGWEQDRDSLSARLRECAVLLGGALAVLGIVIIRYLVAGELAALLYWTVTYNAEAYMLPFADKTYVGQVLRWMAGRPENGIAMLGIAMLIVPALGRVLVQARSVHPAALLRGYAAMGFEATVALAALLTVAAAIAPLRFWPHYYLLAAPWVGLLIGLRLELLLRGGARFGAKLSCVVTSLLLIVLMGIGLGWRLQRYHRELDRGLWGEQPQPELCAQVDHYSGPEDSMFVWGFRADLYLRCARRPATRYIYTVALLGVVPPFWREPRPEAVAAGAPELAAAEIDRSKPPVLIDLPELFGARSLQSVPPLARIVARDYCVRDALRYENESAIVYARKVHGECPARPSWSAPSPASTPASSDRSGLRKRLKGRSPQPR